MGENGEKDNCWIELRPTKKNVIKTETIDNPIGEIKTIFEASDVGYRKILCYNTDIISLTLMILIFILNTSLVTFIISKRKLRGKKTNKFSLNLFFTHSILSMFGIVTSFIESKPLLIETTLYLTFQIEMIISLVITTCDRFIAIQYPYWYETLTTKTTITIIALSWCVPVLFAMIILNIDIHLNQLIIISTIFVVTAVFVLTFTNLKVYIIARDSARRDSKHSIKKSGSSNNTGLLKSTYVCFTLVSSFILFWLPYLVHNMLAIFDALTPSGRNVVTRVVVLVASLNSVFDPIFFVLLRRDVKKVIRRTLNMEEPKRDFMEASSSYEHHYHI